MTIIKVQNTLTALSSAETASDMGYRAIIWAIAAIQTIIGSCSLYRSIVSSEIFGPAMICTSILAIFLLLRLTQSNLRDTVIDLTIYEIIMTACHVLTYFYGLDALHAATFAIYEPIATIITFTFFVRLLWLIKDKETGTPMNWPPIGILSGLNATRYGEASLPKPYRFFVYLIILFITAIVTPFINILWSTPVPFLVLTGVTVISVYSNTLNHRVAITVEERSLLYTKVHSLKHELDNLKKQFLAFALEEDSLDMNQTASMVSNKISDDQLALLNELEAILPGYKEGLIAEIYNMARTHRNPQRDTTRLKVVGGSTSK